MLDEGLLDSALASPRNYFAYGVEDAVRLAVVMLVALARNPPFMQGNKRTAFAVAVGFLQRCGYDFIMPDSKYLAEAITAVVVHEMGEQEFEGVIRDFVVPLDQRLKLTDDDGDD